ncbi:hypothetical protein [Natronoglycomyces albus]|uniref:Uncharacterized protein n=1 Tax=Natronoglycomyces albus TaxID=2811108 RepID=A0A895XPR3_9ACTN|nr:hypothetical protein [Natronoglycomyces albus]QSB05095.1 hypothetical protein JQS30_15255 [Natronoglycomyces albus]
MSLPEVVLHLSTEVLADLNDDESLAFAFAHGPAVAEFGQGAELLCVWDLPEAPSELNGVASHITVGQFHSHLDELYAGRGWYEPGTTALTLAAQFSHGTLLADDSELGSEARGRITDFPDKLIEASAQLLQENAEALAKTLIEMPNDPWHRAHLLDVGLHRAYVAFFAASEEFFPGIAHRADWVRLLGLDEGVLEAERGIWASLEDPGALSGAWRCFAERVLKTV